MAEKEKFFCHEGGEITEDFCIGECKSTQRGVKAECPESVKLSPEDKRILEDFLKAKELGRELGHKPGHKTHQPAKGRWGRRRTKI